MELRGNGTVRAYNVAPKATWEELRTLIIRPQSRIVKSVILVVSVCMAAALAGICPVLTAQSRAKDASQSGWWDQVSNRIRTSEYDASPVHPGASRDRVVYQAPNRANDLRMQFEASGLSVAPRTNSQGSWSLQLSGAALQSDDPRTLPASELVEPTVEGRSVAYERARFTERYVNRESGLELAVTVRPPAAGDTRATERGLVICYNVLGDLNAVATDGGQSVDFLDRDGHRVLRLVTLSTMDAFGQTAPGALSVNRSGGATSLRLSIDTAAADYPITMRYLLSRPSPPRSIPDQGVSPITARRSGASRVEPLLTSQATGAGATSSARAGDAAWMFEAQQNDAQLGLAVSQAGDVNGDGYGDVLVAAWLFDGGQTNEGRVYGFYGSAAGLSLTADWTAEANQAGARLGHSVATAGDVNGDGYDDVILGADFYTKGQREEGRAFVYLGSAAGLGSTAAWTAESDQPYAHFGVSVSTAGDVNADGYDDVLVGAYRYDSGQTDEGRVYLYYGSATGLGLVAWTAESNQASARLGHSVATAGDVNGDGYDDLLLGAGWYDNGRVDAGRVYVYLGSSFGPGPTPDWVAEGNQASALFGAQVSSAGDVNGDGYDDVIISAQGYDNGEVDEGAAFTYYGSPSGLGSDPAWVAEGNQAGAWFGWAVGTAGDVNGDGFDDVMVGAPFFDDTGIDEGAAFVYYGSTTGFSLAPDWQLRGDQNAAQLGATVRLGAAGDVNGDGYGDVLVGARLYDNGQVNEGQVYLFVGSVTGLPSPAVPPAEPDITVAPNSVNFGQVVVGNSAETSVTVSNTGTESLTVNTLSTAAPFSVVNPITPFTVNPGASQVVTVRFSPTAQGVQSGTLDMASNDPDEPLVSVPLTGNGVLTLAYRLNVGGADYTTSGGELFVAEQAYVPGSAGYTGGEIGNFPSPISGTEDDPLYQDMRGGYSFSYRFDGLPAGGYQVTLYFTDPLFSTGGQRRFDVLAEGVVVLNDYDIALTAGGALTAVSETFAVSVVDGQLNLDFLGVVRKALVSAVAVVKIN